MEIGRQGQKTDLDILLLLGVHPHLGRILGGLVALAGIDVVRVGLDGPLTLIHGGLVRVDREVGRVGERHVTNSWCAAKMATLELSWWRGSRRLETSEGWSRRESEGVTSTS